MPTNAEYMTLVGDNRIISLINDDGQATGVAVPKTLENTLYAPAVPGDDQEGNRKIIIKMRVNGVWTTQEPVVDAYEEDKLFRLKVEVPKGVIASPGPHVGNAVQNIVVNNPIVAADTPLLSYMPLAYAIPANETCYPEVLVASPIRDEVGPSFSPNQALQSVDIQIRQYGTDPAYYAPAGDPPLPQPPTFDNEMLFYVIVEWPHSLGR